MAKIVFLSFYNIATFFSYIINLADIRCNNSLRRSDIQLFNNKHGGCIEHLVELLLKVPK